MTSTDPIAQVDPTAAIDLAADGALLLDVREPEEWRLGHIGDAVHIPLSDLRPESVPRDRLLVAVCRSGNRSGGPLRSWPQPASMSATWPAV